MDSKNTSVTVAQPERADMPFDLSFDTVKVSMLSSLPKRQFVDILLVPLNLTSFMQGQYQLKRKAVDERWAARKKPRPAVKDATEIFALLETEDLLAKLEFKNSILMKGIKPLQEIIRDETSITCGTKMAAWRKEVIDSTRQNCDKALKERKLSKQFSELLVEYKSNKELMKESWANATLVSKEWVGLLSMPMTCNLDLQIRVLGIQKLQEILDNKKVDIISEAISLQYQMKNLGVDYI
jgi:hypothetical protein